MWSHIECNQGYSNLILNLRFKVAYCIHNNHHKTVCSTVTQGQVWHFGAEFFFGKSLFGRCHILQKFPKILFSLYKK
jgi:hypothetical protein